MQTFERHQNKKQPTGYGLIALMLSLITLITFSQGEWQGSKVTGTAMVSSTESAATAETEAASEEANVAASEAVEAEEMVNPALELAPGYNKPEKMPIRPAEQIDSETLWLARCIYSETKQPREQELVAWVIRNRVETSYRGNRTYREAVLDPYQFSAFNPGSRKRSYYSRLTPRSQASGWQQALAIAYEVRHADSTLRPFPSSTRHFFSERSMAGGRHPGWSRGERPVDPDRPYQIQERRFRFYKDVS